MIRTISIFLSGFVAALLFVAAYSWATRDSRISEPVAPGSGPRAENARIGPAGLQPTTADRRDSADLAGSSGEILPAEPMNVDRQEDSAALESNRFSTPASVPDRSEQSSVARTIDAAGDGGPAAAVAETETIPVTSEVADFFESPNGHRAAEDHGALESEGRDAAWSAYMEQQIAAYLFQKQELIEEFSFPVIHCRSSMCEVQAVGYSPNAMQTWVNATSDIYIQPWFEFTSVSSPISMSESATVIVLFLTNEAKRQGPRSETPTLGRS